MMDVPVGERRSERPWKMWLGLLVNGGARALVVAAPMVTLPMITHSLGKTNYGAYAVVTTIATFLPWADLGIGLSMVTEVSRAVGRNDAAAVRKIVSAALVMVLWVGGGLLVVAMLLAVVVDWRAVLGLTDQGVSGDVGLAVLFVFLSFGFGIPANIGMKTMLGLQMNRAFAFWQAATVPAVVLAVAVAYLSSASLPWFVLATVGTPNVMALAATLWLFRRARPDTSPRLSLAESNKIRGLLLLGAAFLVNNAAAAIAYSSNSLVVSHVIGVDAVAVYNISIRLSLVPVLVFESLLLPLWPIFGAGLAAGDLTGIRTRLRQAVVISTGAGIIAAVVYVVAAPTVITMWVGRSYVPSTGLLVALGVWCVVQFVGHPFALMLSGAGAKTFVLVTAVLLALSNLPLAIVLAHAVGVSGPPWANSISTVVFVLVPSVYYTYRLVGRRDESPVPSSSPIPAAESAPVPQGASAPRR
jgi:O-antigen/teichoic acid export membrane protein